MRRDQAKGRVLANGVVVPPGLRVNEMTLAEKADQLADQKIRVTEDMARRCGFGDDEIAAYFHPAPNARKVRILG